MGFFKAIDSKVFWQALVLGIMLMASCSFAIHDLPNHRWPMIIATIFIEIIPILVAGAITFDFGRDFGYFEGRRIADLVKDVRQMESTEEAVKQARSHGVPDNLSVSAEEDTPGSNKSDAEFPARQLIGRLGELTHITQERFWNTQKGFDPQNRDTYTPQVVIIDWIKAQGTTSWPISEADAKAIEKVACPIKR